MYNMELRMDPSKSHRLLCQTNTTGNKLGKRANNGKIFLWIEQILAIQ